MKNSTTSKKQPYIVIAYYRRKYVFVPLYHVPEGAYNKTTGNLHHYSFEYVDSKDDIERPLSIQKRKTNEILEKISIDIQESILPWNMPLKEVVKLCKKNNLPLSWVLDLPRQQLKI